MPLWLGESDVRAALNASRDPNVLVHAMESALAAFSTKQIDQPVRTAIEIGDRSFFAVMPAFGRGPAVLGAKLVTVVPANAARGLHTHLAVISLFDSETGELIALMDGRYITEVRTAAVSAVSVQVLAREDSHVLAILGSGVQARSHLDALRRVRPFDEIRVWSPNPGRLGEFAAEAGPPARVATSAQAAVEGADAVLVATSSVTPVLESGWVQDGAHVIAIGACRPSQRELDPDLIARASLVVDSRAAALQESGDIVQAIREGRFDADHIRAELGEIIAGRSPARTSAREVTVFKSLGLAIEDLAAANLAFLRARDAGLGIHLTLK